MASLTIRPGSRIRLKGQAAHIPDFFVVRCDREQCWVRQQEWNPEVELNVRFTQILVPEAGSPVAENLAIDPREASPPPDNVVYMDDYRQRHARR
jgi:hypothetical protein